MLGRILVDPHNPDLVLVAALGHAYGPNAERGAFRSTDGGHTWGQGALPRSPRPEHAGISWVGGTLLAANGRLRATGASRIKVPPIVPDRLGGTSQAAGRAARSPSRRGPQVANGGNYP